MTALYANGPVNETIVKLKDLIRAAIDASIGSQALPDPGEAALDFFVEIPADTTHGDFACNVAMACARVFRRSPMDIAEAICKHIQLDETYFVHVQTAPPGFINFFVHENWFSKILIRVLDEKADYGRTTFGNGQKIMVEFVSANPTGPMHMGNARGGALGDVLSAAFDWAGYDVCREFYINDAGNQIEKFALSLEARYMQHFLGKENFPFPEDGYHGSDISQRAQQYIDIFGDKLVNEESQVRRSGLTDFALPLNIASMKADLELYRIDFDNWFPESRLHESGEIFDVIKKLGDSGLTYEHEGALWYRSTQFGSEKDDVLIRANGFPTYFAADIAYHANKFITRGFAHCINIWGADHHGHVARLKGAIQALGIDPERLDIVLMQLVRLTRGGEPIRMSKRSGNAVTLRDLLDEVPVDAARFFFNMREPGSALDFDLNLAVEQSNQNPVYYVQYAHARICSILKTIASQGVVPKEETGKFSLLTEPEERELIRKIAQFCEEIISAAKNLDPARITRYVSELATLFHRFYTVCRVMTEDEDLMQARLSLCVATKQVIANSLRILKIDAPETM